MAHSNKIKALLSDLGRSTKRGVKKCPSCGTYNGTRTVMCKTCYLTLKPNNKRVSPSEVCRLLTPSSSRIFSYISSENIDFDERGFIHFPDTKNKEINKMDTGICLVRSCGGRLLDNNILKCHETALNTSIQSESCKHINTCFDCNTIGVSLKIDQQVLESFRVPQNVKQEVWTNFVDKKNPYLQRVSENIFVVRCKITTQNPLGYLHCIIGKYNRCFCCTTTLVTVDQMDQIPDLNTYFCCHYIACLSAIATSRYMVQEFEKNLNPFVSISTLSATIVQLDNLPNVQVAMAEESNGPVTFFDDQMIITSETCVLESIAPKYHRTVPNILSKKRSKKPQNNSRVKKKSCHEEPQFINPNPILNFEKWLSSVTERINQEMHYQFDGNPPTMVFHIHKTFFECLRERMCVASAKKRLPNYTLVFVKRDSLPLGTFTKYTWHINNILLVKNIFETPLVPLNISRSFIRNIDGTYDAFEHERYDYIIPTDKSHQPIQPNDFKTFLKVGIVSEHQKEPIPFIIEWIPDVLPITEIGELRLTFKYGHMPPKENTS